MKIIVLYRHTENWLNRECRLLHGLTNVHIKKWESFFRTDFYKHRHFLKSLASQSLVNYKVESVSDWLTHHEDTSDDDIIIPCDDDDWLHPDMLRYLDSDSEAFLWDTYVLQMVSLCGFHRWHSSHMECSPIGYGVRYSAWKKLDAGCRFRLLNNHEWAFHDVLAGNMKAKFINESLGVYLWNFASSSVMKNLKLKTICPYIGPQWTLPEEINWCEDQYLKVKVAVTEIVEKTPTIKMLSIP